MYILTLQNGDEYNCVGLIKKTLFDGVNLLTGFKIIKGYSKNMSKIFLLDKRDIIFMTPHLLNINFQDCCLRVKINHLIYRELTMPQY